MPPEYVLTALVAASARPNRSSSSSARRVAARVVSLLSRPIMTRLDRPVRYSSSAAYWPVSPMVRRTTSASATTSWPSTLARPPSGRSSVASTRTAVVFPAPFGSEQPVDGSLAHRQVQAVERLRLPVVLDQSLRLDGGSLTHRFSDPLPVRSYGVLYSYAVR